MNNEHYTCPFSHLILSGKCACAFSAKDCVAEKEFGTCLNQAASNDCQSLYQHLRDNSDFVLKSHHQSNLSVGQQSKIKMGGLLALQDIIKQSSSQGIDDITQLVGQVKKRYGSFEDIAFSELMPTIAKFTFRTRKKIKPKS